MDGDRISMPFHEGELRAQALAGVEPFNAPIRNRMPDQHRTFFPLLPFVCVAVADADGWPLATLVQGPPGFASTSIAPASNACRAVLLDASPRELITMTGIGR